MTGEQTAEQRLQGRGLLAGRRRRQVAQELSAEGSPEALAALARGLVGGADGRVGVIARTAPESLADQAGIDAVRGMWAQTRDPTLEALLVDRRWVASTPPTLRRRDGLRSWSDGVVPLWMEGVAFELIVGVLRWRRRFDVEVVEWVVRAGEFDIELGV